MSEEMVENEHSAEQKADSKQVGQNLTWHTQALTQTQRSKQKNQASFTVWFTGLSGSGKSTLANALDLELFKLNKHSYILDGDNVRHGLNKDLGFSDVDRVENIRRIGEVSKLLGDAGLIVLTAFISPFTADRDLVREMYPEGRFIEVYVKTPLSICEERDPKGLYKKARAGQIPNFTGIDSPYQEPVSPEIVVDNHNQSVEENVQKLIAYFSSKGFL